MVQARGIFLKLITVKVIKTVAEPEVTDLAQICICCWYVSWYVSWYAKTSSVLCPRYDYCPWNCHSVQCLELCRLVTGKIKKLKVM